jgi:hypothetical protein
VSLQLDCAVRLADLVAKDAVDCGTNPTPIDMDPQVEFQAPIYRDGDAYRSLGPPAFHFNGGGNNGIHYDHCLTEDLMAAIPPPDFHSTKPLKVLSFRILPY